MQKRHVHTTLSLKHAALLDKLGEKHGNKQKALELALDSLENSSRQTLKLSPQEEEWLKYANVKTACFIQVDCLKLLIATADMDMIAKYTAQQKPLEFTIEYYYQKPLKECTLEEIVKALVINSNMSHWFDTASYADDGDHYTIKKTHSLGINNSKMMKILEESVFNTYGARVETVISEMTIFIKVFKKG